MALSRKYLKGMGLTEEQVNAIIEANEETINGLKEEIDKHKNANETSSKELTKVQKELDELKESIEDADKKNPWKDKYEGIKKEFDTYKAEEQAKATKNSKLEAYKALLKESGVSEKRLSAILKVTDVDSLEIDKDGKLTDADKLKESIKDEWGEFIVSEQSKGADTATPPDGNKNVKDLDSLDMADYIKARKEG
ncbi:MAG: hypothetical protein IJV15_01665 [Lachnospiraceae bacterium]|nr:hypothetical protein [Lachnospiraceae bacterium]